MNDDLEDLPCLWYHRIPLAEPPPGLARPPSTPTTWVWSVTACFVGKQSVVFPQHHSVAWGSWGKVLTSAPLRDMLL